MNRLIAGEFGKLFTTRLWLWMLLASMGLTALYASLDIAFADEPGNFAPHPATAAGQRLLYATSAGAARTLVAVLAAIGLATEYRHRTATATFLATPQRGRVVAAKLIAYALTGAGYAVVCLGVVTAIAVPWLSTKDITISMTGNGLPATFAGVIAVVAIYALIGVGIAALLRDQVATIVVLLIYLFVAEPIITRIPAWEHVTMYLPGPAASALAGLTLTDQNFLAPWQGGLVLAGYGLGFAILGSLIAIRRDVT
jgi:ABC-2 type transport system permease protein